MTSEIQLDDDVFDESFLKELDKLEEYATSSTQFHRHNQQPQQPPPSYSHAPQQPQLPPQQPPRQYFPSTSTTNDAAVDNYSPPRELSQRFNPNNNNNNINNSNSKSISSSSISISGRSNTISSTSARSSRSPITPPNPEIDFLKSELSRVSKQLSDLKDECSVLRKERDKKEQLKFVHYNAKTGSCDVEAPSVVRPKIGTSVRGENLNSIAEGGSIQAKTEQKSVGIQTDIGDESASPSISGASTSFSGLPKLLAIWPSRSSHNSHRKFVAKLLEICATDFCALFGFLGLNMTSKTLKECLADKPLPEDVVHPRSTEATRLSQLYSAFNQLSNDMVQINAFVDILLNLCKLENALVVHRSLRILRVAATYLLSTGRTCSRRDHDEVERCDSGSVMGKVGVMCDISGDEMIPVWKNISIAKNETTTSVDWFHVFTSMCQTAVRMTEKHVKAEAVSVMNIILRGMNPYSERGQFGESCVYEAIAVLLKRDAGFFCQKEAVHLVYLLLNCPNILATFCSSGKDTEGHVGNFTHQASCAILDGVADCVLCPGQSLKELSLCRNAIIVLAFLASSGKSGLDIFLYHKLDKRGNFLGLILQVLVLEIDAEELESCLAPEISKERTLLLREALILLNRLVSHPAHAISVLQVLTSCRDIVSLAIDIATRLSKRNSRLQNSDFITKQMRESEVVDLACRFRERLFAFLKESNDSK